MTQNGKMALKRLAQRRWDAESWHNSALPPKGVQPIFRHLFSSAAPPLCARFQSCFSDDLSERIQNPEGGRRWHRFVVGHLALGWRD